MNEFEFRDELKRERESIKTFGDLLAFLAKTKGKIEDLESKESISILYGLVPRAIAQVALATAYKFAEIFGITGFQAQFVMWDFIRDWMYQGNECGLKITDYDNMLYPQYEDQFEKTISQDTWDEIQKKAKKKLEEYPNAHPSVIDHWMSIANGDVPFGYRIRSDE